MDNRNDLQWRPEDWEHTLGHLRKAERLLLLKTWGIGSAVVGTVATGAVLYLQPEVEEPNRVTEAIEVDAPAESTMGSVQSPEVIDWSEANSLPFALSEAQFEADETAEFDHFTEVETTGLTESKALAIEWNSESGSSPLDEIEEVGSTPTFIDNRHDAGHSAPLQSAYHDGNASNDAFDLVENSIAMDATVRDLRYLNQINPFESTQECSPSLISPQLTNQSNVVTGRSFLIPLRLSVNPLNKGAVLETPTTLARLAGMRIELTPGVSFNTAEQYWSAWHPAEVYGTPDVLRRVNSDFALDARLSAAMLMPVGHLVEVGLTAGMQGELTRRMDLGIWDIDASTWEELEDASVWGRVEEANPWSAMVGARLDYAVAPEWKIVVQGGVLLQRDVLRKQAAIEASSTNPMWLQIGIQR